ncbi:MAG: endonuclease/exonuclease/phosphatase family protein, partial [Bacteroidales bacterium]
MPYTIMFYNLENLYDTIDDPKTNDDEFTPSGAKRWDLSKY